MNDIVLAGLIFLILIVIYWTACSSSEHMTRIRRTVGVANEANETQVAAGVVNSVPIMDYTYTYWDGERDVSCDECPNEIVCAGSCPHMTVTRNATEHFDLSVGNHDDSARIIDIDADYMSSRERLGASRGRRLGKGDIGHISRDDTMASLGCPGEHFDCNLMRHGIYCTSARNTINFLYGNTEYPPAPLDCVYNNKIGYQYKEPCELSSIAIPIKIER